MRTRLGEDREGRSGLRAWAASSRAAPALALRLRSVCGNFARAAFALTRASFPLGRLGRPDGNACLCGNLPHATAAAAQPLHGRVSRTRAGGALPRRTPSLPHLPHPWPLWRLPLAPCSPPPSAREDACASLGLARTRERLRSHRASRTGRHPPDCRETLAPLQPRRRPRRPSNCPATREPALDGCQGARAWCAPWESTTAATR